MLRGARVFCAEMMLEANHRMPIDYIGYKMGHRPKRRCDGPSAVHPENVPLSVETCLTAISQ
jgi:hypothetical protein